MSSMLWHLGHSLRAMRKQRSIKLVRVGATLDKSEAALSRFESGKSWPNDLDAAVEAYAHELDVSTLEIWANAVKHMREEPISDDESESRGRRESQPDDSSLPPTSLDVDEPPSDEEAS